MSESTKISLEDGTVEYRNAEGQLHRVDGPARIGQNGTQSWYQNGVVHRVDGPSVTLADGTQHWIKNGQYHREDGPAIIEPNGTQIWYKNDERHREDGPATICAGGTQEWYKNDERHREDGPAWIWANGHQEWYLFGIEVTEELVKNLDSLNAEKIHNEKNTELRACLISHMGWVNYLREINAKPIDSRHNHVENTKEALYWVNRLQQKQLFVTCPTGRVFNLHLPKHIKTCAEAQSWLGNDVEKKYNVIGRT